MCGTNIITCIWIQVGSSCQSAAATILASFLQQQQLCSSEDWGDGGKSKPSLSLMSVILTWAWPGSCSVRRGRDDRMIRWHDRMDVCHNHQIITIMLHIILRLTGTLCPPYPPQPPANDSFLLQLNIHCGFIGVVSLQQNVNNLATPPDHLLCCGCVCVSSYFLYKYLKYPFYKLNIKSANFDTFFLHIDLLALT